MKPSGSVLIVVLGLLAILAVIGITFITMSNLDRRTAANFAVQSQFMLAADGAVDYVCHHLVQDLWTYNTMSRPEESGVSEPHNYYGSGYLLSDHGHDWSQLNTERVGLLRNEPFDYPGVEYDPWLSSSLDGTESISDNRFSYGYQTPDRFEAEPYGIEDWGTSTHDDLRPNNVGFPTTDGTVPRYTSDIASGRGHGVWIPDLSFPFEAGLIRVSVTVLDHGAMLNLNAHGNKNQGNQRKGFYISDVDPSFLFNKTGGGMPTGFFNSNGTPPGLWDEANRPGNRAQRHAVIENPAAYGDCPFTLDEEFELRRLTGTYFSSRLEELLDDGFPNKLGSTPDTATTTPAANRLNLTTVGWTAEVRPNWDPERSEPAKPDFSEDGYDSRKVDLNLDSYNKIKAVLEWLEMFEDNSRRDQFAANICAFRDGRHRDDDKLLHQYGGRYGASPQPVFRQLEAEFLEITEKIDEDDNATTTLKWNVTVRIFNPWRRLYLLAPKNGLPLHQLSAELKTRGGAKKGSGFGDVEASAGGRWLPFGQYAKDLTCTVTREFNKRKAELLPDEKDLSNAVQSISLKYGGGHTIDRIDNDYIAQVGDELTPSGSPKIIERGVLAEPEGGTPGGGSGDDAETDVLVVYIFLDRAGGGSEPPWFDQGTVPNTPPRDVVPIRFPRSVKSPLVSKDHIPAGGLPPEWTEDVSGGTGDGEDAVGFRAFPRVGDLNQVLCRFPREGEDDTGSFWPWVPRVAATRGDEEKYVKFSWYWSPQGDDDGNGDKRIAAANLFTAGGPWLDRIDNDGDGYADAGLPAEDGSGPGQTTEDFLGADNGKRASHGDTMQSSSGGRFGGSEIRVAGKINLNTASREVLEALGKSFGITNLANAVCNLRSTEPITSPAEIVNEQHLGGGSAPDCTRTSKGHVERKDLPYTLISNIATVRSDTFSIYGTVQYIDVQAMYEAQTTDARHAAVRRSRRFWALVDRSPCLCQNPAITGGGSFIRPRVMNFQWMD